MKRALERHTAGDAVVIPVILRDCDWQATPFAQLQALPEAAKPISRWRRRDTAWTTVVAGIRRTIERITADAVAEQRSDEILVETTSGGLIVREGAMGDSAVRVIHHFKPWRLRLVEDGQPRLFAFKAGNAFDGICEIERHQLYDGRVLVVVSQIPDNPGQSTTNAIEFIARQLADQFDVEPNDLIVVEHFADARHEPEWELVQFASTADEYSLGKPTWRPVTDSDWQQYGLRPRKRRALRQQPQPLLVKHRR